MKRKRYVFVLTISTISTILLSLVFLNHHRNIPHRNIQSKVVISATKVHLKTAWTKNDSRELAKEYAWAGFGWKGREWGCIKELWWRESRWDFRADNSKSTAYGLAQLLGEKSTSPQVQVLKGYRYIEQRFATPCKALGFHNRHGYY